MAPHKLQRSRLGLPKAILLPILSIYAAESSVSVSLDGSDLLTTTSTGARAHQDAASALLSSIASLRLNDTDNKGNDESPSPAVSLECGIWLAPSTIPGAGLGLYAGRHFQAEEQLQQSGDLTISIVDLRLHTRYGHEYESFLWDEYTWNAQALNVSASLGSMT